MIFNQYYNKSFGSLNDFSYYMYYNLSDYFVHLHYKLNNVNFKLNGRTDYRKAEAR